MKFYRFLGAGLAAFAMLLITSCNDPSEAKKRYAFVTNGVADFWTIGETGAHAAATELGVEVSVLMPGGIPEQKQMLEDLISRGFDGIAVSPIDPANQTEIIDQVAEATHLITHDSDAPESKRLVYIGMDNYTAGRMGGQLVKEALPEGGSIMIMIGRIEQDNAKRRRQGLIDELMGRPEDPTRYDPPGTKIEGNNFVILDTLTDQFDRAKAKANAEDTLSRYPDVSAMVGLFAYNPPAILQALEQAGKLNQVKVIAFDEDTETLAGIQNGTVHGTIVQNPYMYGYKSVEVLKAIDDGDMSVIPEDKFINFPGRQIRKDNVNEFWADLKAKLGQ